jgi:uncharacterized protein YkwD
MPLRSTALRRLPIALLSLFAALLSPAMSHGRVAVAPQQYARAGAAMPHTSNVLAAEGWRTLATPSIAIAPSIPAAPIAEATATAIPPPALAEAGRLKQAQAPSPPRPVTPPPAAASIVPPPASPAHPAAVSGGWYDDAFTANVRDLVNAERAKAGLGPVGVELRLAASAAGYAKVLSDNNWFSHVGPDGSTLVTRAEAAGFPFNVQIGEVLAWGTDAWSPAGVVQAWMSSPSHREELLNGVYTRAGAACYFTPANGVTVHCVIDLAG